MAYVLPFPASTYRRDTLTSDCCIWSVKISEVRCWKVKCTLHPSMTPATSNISCFNRLCLSFANQPSSTSQALGLLQWCHCWSCQRIHGSEPHHLGQGSKAEWWLVGHFKPLRPAHCIPSCVSPFLRTKTKKWVGTWFPEVLSREQLLQLCHLAPEALEQVFHYHRAFLACILCDGHDGHLPSTRFTGPRGSGERKNGSKLTLLVVWT